MQRMLSACFAAVALVTVGCQQQLSLDSALATGEQNVTSIAVDDGFVYWTRADGTVRKLSLETGQVMTVGTRASMPGNNPANLVQDDTFLYWSVGSDLLRIPKAGGTPEVHTQQAEINGLSLDETNLYFTSADNQILKASKEGIVVDSLAMSTNPKPILAGAGNVLWGAQDAQGSILQVPTGGGLPDPLLTQPTGEVLTLAQDTDHIYWGTFANEGDNGSINVMLPDATSPKVIFHRQATPTAMLSDSSHLYWSNTIGEIHAAPVAGGDEQRIVQGPTSCASNVVGARVSIAMDATNIYWANGCDDAILTMPRL